MNGRCGDEPLLHELDGENGEEDFSSRKNRTESPRMLLESEQLGSSWSRRR